MSESFAVPTRQIFLQKKRDRPLELAYNRIMSNTTDLELLKYAGVLGHTVIVVCGTDGERSARLSTCDMQSAREFRDGLDSSLEPTIYKKHGKGWRVVVK